MVSNANLVKLKMSPFLFTTLLILTFCSAGLWLVTSAWLPRFGRLTGQARQFNFMLVFRSVGAIAFLTSILILIVIRQIYDPLYVGIVLGIAGLLVWMQYLSYRNARCPACRRLAMLDHQVTTCQACGYQEENPIPKNSILPFAVQDPITQASQRIEQEYLKQFQRPET